MANNYLSKANERVGYGKLYLDSLRPLALNHV